MIRELDLEISLFSAYHLLDERFTHDCLRLLRQRHLVTADSFDASERRLDLMLRDLLKNHITPIEGKLILTPEDILETLYTREYLYNVKQTFPDAEINGFIFLSYSSVTDDVKKAVQKARRTFGDGNMKITAVSIGDFLENIRRRFCEWNADYQFVDRLEQDRIFRQMKQDHKILFTNPNVPQKKVATPTMQQKLNGTWKVLNITASVKNKDGRECLVQVVQHGNKYSFVVTSSGEKLIEGSSQPELTFGLPNQAIKAGLEELKRRFA